MDQLVQQVERARWRLWGALFLNRLNWCWFTGLLIALAAIAAPKVMYLGTLPPWWNAAWVGGALGGGLLVALVWSLIKRHSQLEAAQEVDRRFNLRERLASSLSLAPDDAETPAGAALVKDAVRAAERIDIGEHFRVSLDRRAWWPLVPGALAFVLAMFVANQPAPTSANPLVATASPEAVKKSIEQARKELAKRAAEAEKKGLKDAADLLKEIDRGTKELDKETNADQKKAAVKLNDLAKQLEERKQELGSKQALSEQLNKMKDFGKGPADKAANAIQQGDFQKALEEINKLQQQLAKGEMSKEAKQQLANQLQKMQQQLKAAADQNKQQQADLKKQLEQAQKNGDLATANKLQQKLDQLKQQAPQMNKLNQLAQKLGQAQQAMQQGDNAKAAEAMAQMAQELAQMQQDAESMEMLDQAMSDIEMAKAQMGCKACNGDGCQACQGLGMGQGKGNPDGKPGRGMGEGRGEGPRPDEKNPTSFRDTQVKQNVGRGASTFGGLVSGPNMKGQVVQSIKEEMTAESVAPADPLANERLPKSRREHAEEYFKKLREEL